MWRAQRAAKPLLDLHCGHGALVGVEADHLDQDRDPFSLIMISPEFPQNQEGVPLHGKMGTAFELILLNHEQPGAMHHPLKDQESEER